MTKDEFLAEVAKHLRPGHPETEKILSEIREKFDAKDGGKMQR